MGRSSPLTLAPKDLPVGVLKERAFERHEFWQVFKAPLECSLGMVRFAQGGLYLTAHARQPPDD